ncbi:MAG: ATP-grasp domain-containing protein [Clostridiales bacterium]
MRIIFFCNPMDSHKVDMEYEFEYKIAKKLGLNIGLVNYEGLVSNFNPDAAVNNIISSIKNGNNEKAILRGWMLKPKLYEKLYLSLLKKNIKLLNTPEEYRNCHYIPYSYEFIKNYTPKTVWIEKEKVLSNIDTALDVIKDFNGKPVIVKDYVKSRKYDWEEACYIPNSSDAKKVKGVVNRFLELQGEDLNGGIAFREFVDLEFLTKHSKSNLPLSKEFRLFFVNKELIQVIHYWDEGDYGELEPDLNKFTNIAQNIKSNFFTMDIAKEVNGNWIILELGDGQVSWLPKTVNVYEFYKNLIEI